MEDVFSKGNKDKMTTSCWFDFACKLWIFSEQFKGLMEFKTVE